MIAENTLAVRKLEEAHKKKATRDDARFDAMEEKVNKITDLMENGGALSLDPVSQIETAHERQLLAMIKESKTYVTVLGHGEKELTLLKLTSLISDHNYHLDGKASNRLDRCY